MHDPALPTALLPTAVALDAVPPAAALPDAGLRWQWNRIDDIEPRVLLGLLQLRSQVFVVEQRCIYPDIDEADRGAWHLAGLAGDRVVATSRLLRPGVRFAEASIGRVCIAADRRGAGLGRALMLRALDGASRLVPGSALRISAQRYLESFYHSLGFVTVSEPYDEDGIEHVEMVRRRPA